MVSLNSCIASVLLASLLTSQAMTVSSSGLVTVCGHAGPFPWTHPLEGGKVTAYLQHKSSDVPHEFGSQTTDSQGGYCFEDLPGDSLLTMVYRQSGYQHISTSAIQLPSEGCYLPEISFQIVGNNMIKAIEELEYWAGTGRAYPYGSQNHRCLAVTTVTRPCQGMYSKHSHGLKGASVSLLRVEVDTGEEVPVPTKEVPIVYLGVTVPNTPIDILPDSTSFWSPSTLAGKIPSKWNEQHPAEHPPTSWDGGVMFWAMPKGHYKVRTQCEPLEDGSYPPYCPEDTVFSEMELSCMEHEGVNNDVNFINMPPGTGPRPVNGTICEGLGSTCGMLIPNPGDPEDKAGYRNDLKTRGQCKETEESLWASMGVCPDKLDNRFLDIGKEQTNRAYWNPKHK